jgi:NADH-quinone oxidoreductase subunit G
MEETESVCPGCSTGCNIFVDHRDGEAQRLRPRRNPDVNKSWICDIGRALYRETGATSRTSAARMRGAAGWESAKIDAALDVVAGKLKAAGAASAFLASPQASNEDLFAFAKLVEAVGGRLDFRVGDPQDKVRVREDEVLRRADHNPNTQGCLDQGLGRAGVAAILDACRKGEVQALVLQGPEMLRVPEAAAALAKVPFVAVMASHEEAALDLAHVVLPAAMWVEYEGSFTNYQRRVQRFRRAYNPLGDARARWELASGLLRRLGRPLPASSARELFGLLAAETRDYAGLDFKKLGSTGVALASGEPAVAEARS